MPRCDQEVEEFAIYSFRLEEGKIRQFVLHRDYALNYLFYVVRTYTNEVGFRDGHNGRICFFDWRKPNSKLALEVVTLLLYDSSLCTPRNEFRVTFNVSNNVVHLFHGVPAEQIAPSSYHH